MTPEGEILKSILDYLRVERITAFRCNTGAVKFENRFVRFGTKGFADILALPTISGHIHGKYVCWATALFIEAKTPTGRQSRDQRTFENEVRDAGCYYLLARSVEDVQEWLKKNGWNRP